MPDPSKPLIKRSFTLYYLQGNLPPLQKAFELGGTLNDARIRGMEHCRKMGYKFVRVRPFLVDLDEQEKLKTSVPEWSEDYEPAVVAK